MNNPSGGQETFIPDPDLPVETHLPNFCNWQAALSVNDDTDPNDWDLALLFTGSVEKNISKIITSLFL